MKIVGLFKTPVRATRIEDDSDPAIIEKMCVQARRLAREIRSARCQWSDIIVARNTMPLDELAGSDLELKQREAIAKRAMARSALDLSDVLRVLYQTALGDWSPSPDECDTGLDQYSLEQVSRMYRGGK
ncbi:MAG TPA: hypothetical protein VGU68_03910 [Ktedonobacteraceae bacterium]|nr:hypothetical protein [Ktedonobacteraceae bacterium]